MQLYSGFLSVFGFSALSVLSVLAPTAYSGHHGEDVGSTLHSKVAVPLDKVPASVVSVIKKDHPKFKMLEAEKELKHGNTYYDIEGLDAQGNEIEFDMLLAKDGTWSIAEIQRDLTLKQVPERVVNVFRGEVPTLKPARIIESDQGGGVIIYEFFTQEKDKERKYEVKLSVELLEKEWTH